MPRSRGKRRWLACGFRAGREIAGDRPPRYGKRTVSDPKNSPLHRRARACPSPCLGREGNGLGRWTIFAQIERSRGTGPRATVKKIVPFTVGRGPVPRHASVCARNNLGWRSVFARVGRSRGTGPRAPVGEAAARLTRSGSGAPELRSLANRDNPAQFFKFAILI